MKIENVLVLNRFDLFDKNKDTSIDYINLYHFKLSPSFVDIFAYVIFRDDDNIEKILKQRGKLLNS